ncbi:MAG: NFACT family protein [Clostridia bacterium]|nr:NFACT family protein [Clostridia bacterium]
MPFDGVTMGIMARDLDRILSGGRVDRIIQPERDELILTVRSGGQNHLLLLSASADCARAHITGTRKTSPLEPSALCMLMRKHLTGSRLVSIRQKYADRIMELCFEHYDELGDKARKILICEFMGKHSNIIFTDENSRILECTRHVNSVMSSVREVLPGLRYVDPPAHGRIPYDGLSAERLAGCLQGSAGPLWKVLSRSISGLSPLTAREIAYRVTGNEEACLEESGTGALTEAVSDALLQMLSENAPCLLLDEDGAPVEFSAWKLTSRSALTSKPCRTLSEAIDMYYIDRDASLRIRQKSASMHRTLRTNIDRLERKLALQWEALLGSERMDEYRVFGELLNANLSIFRRGDASVSVVNYYDAGLPVISIPLDIALTPSQNAQRYFKLYQKARNAKTLAAEQIQATEAELEYLEGQLLNLGSCSTESELAEIREEMEKQGYLRAVRSRRQMKQLPPSSPLRFVLSSGRLVLVGKNNLQNDRITFSAKPDETWLHAKDIPGSHVVIIGSGASDEDILEAAQIAAAHCKANASALVPVDHTLKKYVRKPAGAKPGFVIYTHQKTLYVAPRDGVPDKTDTGADGADRGR